MFRLKLPLRFKIIMLFGFLLALSIFFNLLMGTRLIKEDKVSYIYDYTLTRVKASSESVDGQMQKVFMTVKVMSGVIGKNADQLSKEAVQRIYKENVENLGIDSLLILRPNSEKAFDVEMEVGKSTAELKAALGELAWTPKVYEKNPLLIGSIISGKLPIGGKIFDKDGKPLAFLTFINPKFEDDKAQDRNSNIELYLLDSLGQVLTSKDQFVKNFDPTKVTDLIQGILRKKFDSGVQDWSPEGFKEYIVGYERLASQQLLVVGFIAKDVAFSASELLVKRSLFLGGSILALAIGFTLIFARRLTNGLRQMWIVTQGVSQGNFAVRVRLGKKESSDEIGDLARSFNVMANKIEELMAQTELKAKMQKELETAQAVQNSFFPTKGFENEIIHVAGKSIAASQCGGDWWYYSDNGDYLVVVIGDVTGHGVSAALLTAAAHGAYSTFQSTYCKKGAAPPVQRLIENLNVAIKHAANGSATMTFFAAVINMRTGEMQYINASHRPPFVFRGEQTHTLMEAQCPALGYMTEVDVEPARYQLQPGDMIFWYTDGLVECGNAEGKTLKKTALQKMLGHHQKKNKEDASRVCRQFVDEVMAFLGESSKDLADDITVIVAAIPETVIFEAIDEKPVKSQDASHKDQCLS